MREYSEYRDDLKSQVLEFTYWWEDYICSSPWDQKNTIQKVIFDGTFYVLDGLKYACCLIKGHDYGENINAYAPREYCHFCEMSKPGVLIRRKNKNDEIARHWPLEPKEIK